MKTQINQILTNVGKKIIPAEKEKLFLDKTLIEFEKKLKPKLKKKGAKLFIGGSFAKKTLVKRDIGYDIDIFIMFSYTKYKIKNKKLSKFLEQILKAAKLKFVKLKGSRDYFQINFKGLNIELIPILNIKKTSQALNITDISPLHVIYILKKIKKNKKLSNEIRLAKAFCYAQDCYGAESYIKGFSGYSLEILVSHYGSLAKFINTAANWKLPTRLEKKIVIDPSKLYKNRNEVLEKINESKLHSPIIIVDPVQKERNVAAALSYKIFERFIGACNSFLKKPSEKFFFKEKLNLDKLKRDAKKLNAEFVSIKALSTKNKIDIAGAKLKKLYEFLFFFLKKNGFKVLKGFFVFSEETLEAKFYFILREPAKTYIIAGPPINIQPKYVEAFKKKWHRAFVKKGRLYVKTKRKISSVKQLIKIISKNQLKEMGIKKIKT